ncbi:MAG TPA: molybdopterin-dependent oxidoreductase [Nitrospiraceae bacterium]|nr:molybdopterin-dependent oxidoreductase [Nitrospiraceae bacterium]
MDIKRRTFIQALGLATAGSILPGCEREVSHLVPYVLPDDEIVPGVATWYASTCRECSAGCGITVRVMEGRAKKIEGNPDHPVNRGKLCALGQAAVQGLYNPDRLRGPLNRIGSRFSGEWTSISWDHGIAILSQQLRKACHRTIMVSRPLSGTLAWLVSSFISSIGGRLFYYAPGAEIPVRAAARALFGIDAWPHYDLAGSDYVLSFGAPFLEHWLSPVAYGIAYGEMRQGRPATRGRFVHVEPRLSLTAASADRWVPVRPGTEGLAALGVGHVLLTEGRLHIAEPQRSAYERLYAGVSLDQIATATDVPRNDLIRLAREFAAAAAPLAIGGGTAAAHTNGTDTMLAVNGLNGLVGNVGRPGGVRFHRPASFESGPPVPWLTEQDVRDMADRKHGEKPPALWLLYDANPAFTMPPSIPVRSLFEGAEYVASFSSFLDETTGLADLILPDHHSLESWGDHVHVASPSQAVGLQQPVVTPLYETRAIGDTLFHTAAMLKLPGFSKKDFFTLLKERWQAFLEKGDRNDRGRESDAPWIRALQRGGWWGQSAPDIPLRPVSSLPAYENPRFDGDEQDFPFFLLPYPSPHLGYGKGANLPWLQELPDTLTTAMWGSWAEINPATAHTLGIGHGDVIRVQSQRGLLDIPAIHFPGIRPDVIAVPIGQGHTSYGRYARNRGVNPLSILAPLFDRRTGTLATGATRVRVEPTGRQARLAFLERPGVQPGSELLSIKRLRE